MTHEHAHTALCLWEAWLETKGTEAWTDYRDNHGAVHSRFACIHMAPQVEAVWAALPEEMRDTVCFDWEFVPAMLSRFAYVGCGHFPQLMRSPELIAATYVGTKS